MVSESLNILLMSQHEFGLSTTTITDATQRTWDVLVIGSGPAGCIAARQLSLSGATVLLVDKASFPRRKVCGCYLNGSALQTLDAVGLGELPNSLRAPPVTQIRIGTKCRTAQFEIPTGAALSRESFDTALVHAATEAGVAVLQKTSAKVGEVADGCRQFELSSGGHASVGHAKVIVVADGIGGQSLRDCRDIEFNVASTSLVGVSTMTDVLPANYIGGTIHMAISPAGYVGALQLESGRLDVAAAFDPIQLRQSTPGALAQATVDQSGLPALTGLDTLKWLGTPPLSRTPTAPAAHRLFLIGDAAGYVEPFTGEGISWALASGRAVVAFVLEHIESDSPDHARQWIDEYRKLFRTRQWMCRIVTRGLRRPWLAKVSVSALDRIPSLATPFLRWSNRAPGLETP
jgi:flavin-dependent dehydrogenase